MTEKIEAESAEMQEKLLHGKRRNEKNLHEKNLPVKPAGSSKNAYVTFLSCDHTGLNQIWIQYV